ncbi:MAG TPA: hypothetical protein VG273_08900 [Bryobacteraceae bacterium]|jgi:hypothetical protein|nr:hypothetical protein [Bryobacteraceae bacterium]
MLTLGLMLLWFQPPPAGSDEALIREIAQSGRCATVAETDDSRVTPKPMIAPGQPPLLSFRYYEGQLHGRFGNADLMLDDAGH